MTVETFTAVINQLLPEPHAGLLNGLIFGTRATLSEDFVTALTRTGTLHIIALSGMNISILVRVIHGVLLRFLNRRLTNIATIVGIAGFVWFVGPSPSVVRAAIMGSIVLLSVTLGRQNWSILTLIITSAVMLLVKPEWLGNLSFQLSVLSTLGIILFAGPSRNNVLLDNLYVTLAAQVFTVPLVLFTFERVSLISPVTNVLIGWVIPILTPLGMLVAIAGFLFLPLGQIFAWVAWVFLEYLIKVITITSTIPFASIGR